MNQIVKDKLLAMKHRSTELKTAVDNTLSKIEMQKKFIEDAKKNNQEQIDAKQKDYDDHIEQIDKLSNDVTLIQKHVDSFIATISDEDSMKQKQKKLGQLEAKIEQNIAKVKKEIEFYTKNSTCPTCDQTINNGETKVHNCNSSLTEYSAGLEKLQGEYNKISQRLIAIQETQKKINSHNTEITRINASVTQIQKYVKKLVVEIEELKNKKVLSEDMMNVSKELLEKLEALNTERKELGESKKYIDVAAALLKDSGIKAKIVKQYLPVINKLVNKYLASMDFFVNFEIDEEFKETIKSRFRDEFSYQNFSEGEKMRIDLALLFTWRAIARMKNSMSTNLLILDEVFDSSLDHSGTEEFMKLIHSLNEANVFVISHKGDILMDKFRSVIKFEKVKNFSRIV
jgi:DNA repair exonuclease SbcCD ATPase subunit